jgi:voltage-gated potassium channel
VLFATLVVFFVATPLVESGGYIQLGLNLMIIGAMLMALRTAVQGWRIVALAMLLGVGAVAERVLLLVGVPLAQALIVQTLSMIAFLLVVSIPILLDVYRASVVDFRTILGACSLFLILGFTWYGIFVLIEITEPDSFAFAKTHLSDVWDGSNEDMQYGQSRVARDQLLYYTFVTITTLGFGDIQPVSVIARTYTTLAAVLGQLFLAIMIARLVGMHSNNREAVFDPDSRDR